MCTLMWVHRHVCACIYACCSYAPPLGQHLLPKSGVHWFTQAGQPVSPRHLPVSTYPVLGITDTQTSTSGFLCGCWNSNLSSQACLANIEWSISPALRCLYHWKTPTSSKTGNEIQVIVDGTSLPDLWLLSSSYFYLSGVVHTDPSQHFTKNALWY